jgi:uncharacterized alkaline shock family protein YloU
MPRVNTIGSWPRSAQRALRTTPESTRVQQGKIEVAPHAIATLAGRAVAQCYGVVGVAAPRTRFGKVELLPPERYSHGVVVRFGGDHITIDVHVVLEHGLRITEVARSIMETVKFAVERPLGLRVVQVNVNVLALRVDGRE